MRLNEFFGFRPESQVCYENVDSSIQQPRSEAQVDSWVQLDFAVMYFSTDIT